MLLSNRFKLFNSKGYNLNPDNVNPIGLYINDPGNVGYGAVINAYTNSSGEICYVEILNGGTSYETGTYLSFVDDFTGASWETDSTNLALSPEGEILSFTITPNTNNTGFTYPATSGFVNQFLDPVSTGLISTDHIFIIENVFDENGNQAYTFPRVEEYGPFNISSYEGNGSTASITIQNVSTTGNIFGGYPDKITSIPPADIANLNVGMYLIGTGIPANTQITAIDTLYNNITLSNNVSVTGALSFTCYNPHNLRVGNKIRIFDNSNANPFAGEQIITEVTITQIYFNSSLVIPSTSTTTTQFGVIPIFTAYLATNSDPEFFLFDISYDVDYPSITKTNQVYFELTNASLASPADSIPSGTNTVYQRTVNEYIHKASLQINIGLQSDVQGVYSSQLNIEDITYPTPKRIFVGLYEGETIPEDERLGALLENFGRDVDMNEELIMRDSDVNEDKVDYQILNAKRKEMLIEGDNIWPYVGSYKGLVNVVNWFGYYDIRIKEYWLNVSVNDEYYGKYKQIQIPFQLAEKGIHPESISLVPSNHYKKTNLFGLFYDIVKDSGSFDEYGIPITEDAFAFTNEEVLIKLFALKNYLKNKFLPLNSRIIDITGEGVYYERYGVNSWSDRSVYLNIETSRDVDFLSNSPVNVTDVRYFDVNHGMTSPDVNTTIQDYNNHFKVNGATISAPGGPYYGIIPLVSFAGNSVNQAKGIVRMRGYISSITFTTSKGTGYEINDVITLGGGSYTDPIRIVVTAVDGVGAVISGDIITGPNQGSLYTSIPNMFYQAAVVRPSGSHYVVPAAYGFECLPTDIPFEGEDIYLYDTFDKGFLYSTLPSATFSPNIGGITAALDLTIVSSPPVGFYTDTETLNPWADAPNIAVGAPLNLETNFDIYWDELTYTWNDLHGSSDASFKPWVNNGLVAVEILNQGSEYTVSPDVIISGGNGYGGTATSSIVDGKIKIVEYEILTVATSGGIAQNDVLTLSPALPTIGPGFISPNKIIKSGSTVSDGTIVQNVLQPINTISLSMYDGSPAQTNLQPGDKIYIHQGIEIVTPGVYPEAPNISLSGGRGDSLTWDKLGRYNMYEMEWRLSLSEPQDPTKIFNYSSGVKSIDELVIHTVILPYEGTYTVEMVIYNTNNNFLIKRKNVVVTLPEAEFSFIARYIENGAETWDAFKTKPVSLYQSQPGKLSPPAQEGPTYNWENATGRWVNPVFNTTTWDESLVNWERLDVGNSSQINNYNLPLINPLEVIKISPQDNTEGPILVYTDLNTNPSTTSPTITVLGQRLFPKIEAGDWIFIRRDSNIFQLEVLSADYTVPNQTSIVLNQNPPKAFVNSPTTWEVLREIGGTVVLNGNKMYDPVYNPTGIRINEYVRLLGEDNIPKKERVGINGKDTYSSEPNYITLNGSLSDYQKGGELSKIYKVRDNNLLNGNLNWNPNPANSVWVIQPGTTGDDNYNNSNGKLFIKSSDSLSGGCLPAIPSNEIRPGFTNITIYVELNSSIVYKQRLRTTHTLLDTSTSGIPYYYWNAIGSGYNGVHNIDIATIDGGGLDELNNALSDWYVNGATIWLDYEYAEFPVKTFASVDSGGEIEVYMDFNMYPPTQDFLAASSSEFPASSLAGTGWYYDHGIVSGDISLLVTNTGIWNGGIGTILTLDDNNSELLKTSTSYIAYQLDFNSEVAESYLGTLAKTWANSKQLTWLTASSQSWDTLDYQCNLGCNFRISEVNPLGGIKFNNDDTFNFSSLSAISAEKWSQAIYELTNNDYPSLSRFEYQLGSEYDMFFLLGGVDTYNYPNKILRYSSNGPIPVIGDVVYAEKIGPMQTITNVGVDITLANDIPKKATFIGSVEAGSYFMKNITGLSESSIFVGDVITGTGLPITPNAPATVLEIYAIDGSVKSIKFSIASTVTSTWDSYHLEIVTPGSNVIGFQHLLENGSFYIDAFGKSPSIDLLGTLQGTDTYFWDFGNNVSRTEYHTYPIKNVLQNFGYGIDKIGGFLGGVNEFLINERSLQVYDYEGVVPISPNLNKSGWYPATNLAPAYSYSSNTVFENYLDAETQSNRLPYESAIGGSWRWEDTIIGINPTKIPQGTGVLLTPDASKIAGKTYFTWKIYDSTGLIAEVNDPTVLWTFDYVDEFTIELTIEDTNGNKNTYIKNNFFNVVVE